MPFRKETQLLVLLGYGERDRAFLIQIGGLILN